MRKLLLLVAMMAVASTALAQKLATERVKLAFDEPGINDPSTFGTLSIVLSGASSPSIFQLENYPKVRIHADNARSFRIYQLAVDGNKRGIKVATFNYPVIDQEYEFMFLPAIALQPHDMGDGTFEIDLWELAAGNYAIVFPSSLTRTSIVHTFTLQ